MAFCETNKEWTMTLELESDPSKVERLRFDLEINGSGRITGVVRVSNGERMSQLRGQCKPDSQPGLPPVSLMSFIFRVKKGARVWGVHLSGIAFNPTGDVNFRPFFRGQLRTFTPDIDTPPSEGSGELQTIALLGDPGDTGTGTGQQT